VSEGGLDTVFLGVIAAAVVVIAAIQVAAVLFAARAARRIRDTVSRLEQGVRPIMLNLQALSADAARTAATTAAQVDRAGQALDNLVRRAEEAVSSVQETIVGPMREGLAILHGLKAAFAAFRGGEASRRRPAEADDDEQLFIG
jgi:hypothetical protein